MVACPAAWCPRTEMASPTVNTTSISLKLWGKATISLIPKLSPVPWLRARKPTLKNENLCSTVDVLITDGALITSSRDFLFGFYFRALQIQRLVPYGVKKFEWKSFQTNQLRCHRVVETQSFWL